MGMTGMAGMVGMVGMVGMAGKSIRRRSEIVDITSFRVVRPVRGERSWCEIVMMETRLGSFWLQRSS